MSTNSDILNASQPDGWNDSDWRQLLFTIRHKQCTPFLGAGACAGVLPLGRDIAREWAKEYDYPFQDDENLARVAQFVAIEGGANTPKYMIVEKFQGKGPPDFNNPNEPHRVVADLRLPVYITTNYDDFMVKALERDFPKRRVLREVCKWYLANRRQKQKTVNLDPNPEEPVVFHLHGTLDDVNSMVLTEDDYLNFLVSTSELEGKLIPARIQDAFTSTSLLFMGYSLEDINFKVLFRKLASFLQINQSEHHVAVQLAPTVPRARRDGEPEETSSGTEPEPNLTDEEIDKLVQRAEKQRSYLQKTFGLQKVKIYWATCEQFAEELRKQWETFNRDR